MQTWNTEWDAVNIDNVPGERKKFSFILLCPEFFVTEATAINNIIVILKKFYVIILV